MVSGQIPINRRARPGSLQAGPTLRKGGHPCVAARTEADGFYEYRPHLEITFHQAPQVTTQKIRFARIAATIPAGSDQPAIVLGHDMQPLTLEFSSDGEHKSLPDVVLRLEKAKVDAATFVGGGHTGRRRAWILGQLTW